MLNLMKVANAKYLERKKNLACDDNKPSKDFKLFIIIIFVQKQLFQL
mgnify:CR=1 FL=1